MPPVATAPPGIEPRVLIQFREIQERIVTVEQALLKTNTVVDETAAASRLVSTRLAVVEQANGDGWAGAAEASCREADRPSTSGAC